MAQTSWGQALSGVTRLLTNPLGFAQDSMNRKSEDKRQQQMADAFNGYNTMYEDSARIENEIVKVTQMLEDIDNHSLERLIEMRAQCAALIYETSERLAKTVQLFRTLHDYEYPNAKNQALIIVVPNQANKILELESVKKKIILRDVSDGIWNQCVIQELGEEFAVAKRRSENLSKEYLSQDIADAKIAAEQLSGETRRNYAVERIAQLDEEIALSEERIRDMI